ncbi:DUF4214 domain-containing protein [Oceanospirillum beijerinckii]|uniref:DUF4214 domain-containing protein n=1 Tax=Oceanospirillum beijerinckii TaxID=64976 RepID=UPI0003FF53B8|nr:DUF4214 domain-containing protein [Oceanospirillum beijerinckii]
MANLVSDTSVTKLYVATFNRAPDSAGLDYWVNSSDLDLAGIAASFFDQQETQQTYPAETTNRDFISSVYQNLFNRSPDNEGWDYWEDQLDQGALTRDVFIQAIIDGAEAETGDPDDAAILANKTEVGLYYAENGLSDSEQAKEVMAQVNSESATVISAKNTISELAAANTIINNQLLQFSRIESGIDSSNLLSLGDTPGVSLESDEYWTDNNITFGFNQIIPDEYTDPDLELNLTGWSPISEAAEQVARTAITELQTFSQLTLSEDNSGNADIRFNALPLEDASGFAYYPSTDPVGGDIFLDSATMSSEDYQPGTFAYHTLVHELSHALGLKHPFEDPNRIATDLDNNDYTVMSYTEAKNLRISINYDPEDLSIGASYSWSAMPPSYSILDIATLQAIYGANTASETGNNTYSLSFSDYTYLTIWDAGGEDTIDITTTTGNSDIDLRSGELSSVDVNSLDQQIAEKLAELDSMRAPDFSIFITSAYQDEANNLYTGENNLAIAYGVWIENVLTGSGDDTVRDNGVNNNIQTGAGNDLIQLFDGGFDTVDGGSGSDTVQLDEASSQVTINNQGDGNYLLIGQNFSAQLTGIETLTFTDTTMQLG